MRCLVTGCAVGLSVLLLMATGARAAGPALSVGADRLQGALHCPARFTHPQSDPVLLLHGTGVDAETSWSWNYMRALPADGIDVCSVDLPDYGLGDIQIASEYVVHAVRQMHAATGRKVDVVGHSQGPLEARWAIKWWPDVRAAVDDLVGLSAPNHGLPSSNVLCVLPCDAAVSQFRVGSAFLTAMNAGDETPGEVDQTSVISRSDGLVVPTSTSALDGAANVVIQRRCPLRPVIHTAMVYDAVAYAIVRDALTHAGPAQLSRISLGVCLRALMPKVSVADLAVYLPAVAARIALSAVSFRKLAGEPPLRPYAVP